MESFGNKHLVVFGCGYVGSAVALALRAEGAAVTALTRNAERAAELRAKDINAVVVADLAGEDWHERIRVAPDFVLNCISAGGGGLAGYQRSYVEGTGSLLRWLQRGGGANTLVYTSSTSVYPQGSGARIDESAAVSAEDPASRAGLLVRAETEIRSSQGACQRWFILRLAGIYGPGRHHLVEQVRQGEVSGTGDRRLNLAHRDDIVSAVRACLTAPLTAANEVFNVADDRPSPKAEIVAWLAERLGVPLPRFSGEAASGRSALTPDRVISNEKLRQRLGWLPRYPSFREGYAELGSVA